MVETTDIMLKHFYAAVGARVRSARDGAGLSQSMLAHRIGFTRSSVANLEAGRQRIALHLFVLIAQELGANPLTLLPEDASIGNADVLGKLDEHLADSSESTREFVQGAVAQLVADYRRRES
jgi:transcriptional regulator with XRE-family HTH domain